MKSRFIVAGMVTTLVNLVLHAGVYFAFLRGFYRSHPSGPEEFVRQLARSPEDLVWWAMCVTSLAMGFLITIVMRWSGAQTFLSGVKCGGLFGLLFWVSVNFGLYASSHMFSEASVFVDTCCSAFVMTVSGLVAARLLSEGNQDDRRPSGVQAR